MSGLATFKPFSGSQINIGGSSNTQIGGPMPRYSIGIEPLSSDAVELGQKFTISITGTAVITTSASMLTNGTRQSEINKIISFIAVNKGNAGTLTINPYGGSTPLVFADAKLISADVAEQDELSQGTQTQDYTFSFEAYKITVNSKSTDLTFGVAEKTLVQEYSENWSCAVIEGQHTNLAATDTPAEPMYTITHSISAVGKLRGDGKSSYLNAKTFVDWRISQLGDDPTVVKQDLAITPSNIEIPYSTNFTDYNSFNKVYSYQQDIQAGSYSVDRSWVISKAAASMTVELSSNVDPSAEYNTIDISVTVTGLDKNGGYTNTAKGTNNDKYANALAVFDTAAAPNTFTWANTFYTSLSLGTSTLKDSTRSSSRTDNKSDGIITLNETYNDGDISTDFPCASSQNVNLTETNALGIQQVVAILPVIAKIDGPVIQNMGTTQERTRSATLDLQIKKEDNCRFTKPDGISYLLANYEPTGPDNVYIQGATDSWSPSTGAYSATVDWVWTDDSPTYSYFQDT